MPSTDIKDYYRRAWGLEDRPKFKYGGSWADWMANFSDQMTFEEYLRMDLKEKKPHILDRKAEGGRIGGGIIAGKDLGDRTGFVDPNLVRKEKSIQSYYDIFGKKTLDKISKKKYGKVFSKLEKDNLSNLKVRVTKFKDFILKNNRMPSETEARSLGWSTSRTLTDQGIQIRLVEDLKSGTVDINKLAKKYKIPVEELKTHAKRLERNVWKKRMGTSPLKWLSDEGDTLDNVMNSLYKSKLVQYKRDKIEQLFYDAFGDKKSKTYNPKKWAAMRKNWNEYNKLRNSIKEIFPGIKFELDHPLSKSTLRTIFNASGDQLTRVNPMIAEINNGIKKSLDTQYKNAIANKNLSAKKAIEKIAKDLGINIGKVSDDIKKYNFKVNQFQNLNMSDELAKAVEQQANLAKNLPNYVKNNAELFKTAGIDVKTIKPVTSIDNKTIKEIKKLLNVEDQTKLSNTIQSILNKKNSGLNIVDIAKWGRAELSALDDIAGKIPSKSLGAFGKILKAVGVAGIPLDAVPFTEAHSTGLTPDVGAINLAEIYTNLPGTIWEAGEWVASKVQGKDHEWKPPYEFEFGRDYETKKLQDTPIEVLEKRVDRWATDMVPQEDLEQVSSYLERKGISGITDENVQLQQYEEDLLKKMREKKAIADQKKKEEITGVDKYIINRFNPDV